jgi:hypothetical protein
MKISTKAALLSGLILPGIGHIVLKHYLRASVLMIFALVSLSVITAGIYKRALTIVDRINNEDISLDTAAIAEMVSNPTGGTNSSIDITVIIFGVCWLIGIIDSWKIGMRTENRM